MANTRAFIAVVGLIFALLVVVHISRVAVEGAGALHDPFFVGATLVALAAAIWSLILLLRRRAD